jgi:hypothetical protein
MQQTNHQCTDTLEKITDIKAKKKDWPVARWALHSDPVDNNKDQQYSCGKNEKASTNIILMLRTLLQRQIGN